jgi:hypothetical protein
LPTEKELAAARRVLDAIKQQHTVVHQADALVLRLWAGPHNGLRPLEDIAKQILDAADEPPTQ